MKLNKNLILFILCPLIVYLPAFVTEFGIRNDYLLLPGSLHGQRIFPEAPSLCKLGRPLGAALITVMGWCIQRISDFNFWRVISFSVMLCVAALFRRFLRERCGVDAFWAQMMALSILVLPSTQVFILWIANFPPGSITISLALLSYRCWDSATQLRGEKPGFLKISRNAGIVLAGFFFYAALLIYPATAVFVFVCTFCYLIFSSSGETANIKRRILRDVLFYGGIILAYFIINVKVVLPLCNTYCDVVLKRHEVFNGSLYEFNIAGNLLGKALLLKEVLRQALTGIWHPVWPLGWTVALLIVVLGLAGIYFENVCGRNGRDVAAGIVHGATVENNLKTQWLFSPRFLKVAFWKIAAGILLFVLANLPVCLAKNCWQIPGYRTLFPAAVMMVIIQFAVLYKWQQVSKGRGEQFLPKGIALLLVFCFFAVSGKNVCDVVGNYGRELNFIREKVVTGSGETSDRFLLNARRPLGQATLIGRVIPFEFGFMLDSSEYAANIVNDVRKKLGLSPLKGEDAWDQEMIFFNKRTCLINLDEAALEETGNPAVLPKKAKVRISASAKDVEVIRVGQFFAFHQASDNQIQPVWLIPPVQKERSWIQLDFLDRPYCLKNFVLSLYTTVGMLPGVCLLQGSRDGQHWQSVTMVPSSYSAKKQNALRYDIKEADFYRHYRFYLVNLHKETVMPVRLAAFIFNLDGKKVPNKVPGSTVVLQGVMK